MTTLDLNEKTSRAWVIRAFALVGGWFSITLSFAADSTRLPAVTVLGGRDGFGAYQQPAWANHSRSSATTSAYVLSPFNVYVGATLEAVTPRNGKNQNRLTPEIEIGLPYRFQVAVETDISQEGSRVANKTVNLELRYALADWGKIPLNPTLFAEWKFGTGNENEVEMEKSPAEAADAGEPSGAASAKHRRPDSAELRLLLSENFSEHVEWAFNAFWEQEVGLDREREIGFSQSIAYSHGDGKIKTGLEMQFIATTKKDTRDEPTYSFVVGPTLGVQLTRHSRVDLAPLFGIGRDSPRVDAFAVFSYVFGDAREGETEVPVSMRNR